MRFFNSLLLIPAASGAVLVENRELDLLAERVVQLKQNIKRLYQQETSQEEQETKLHSIAASLSEPSTDNEASTRETTPTDSLREPSASPEELIIQLAIQQGMIDWIAWPVDHIPPVPNKFDIPRQADYANLSARLKGLFDAQIEQDAVNQASAPYLLYDSELLPGPVRIELVRNPPIALNADATVYGLSHGYQVIKYQSNCRSLAKSIMDLERDYIFLRQVEPLGVSPAAVFLSPPVKLPSFRTPKTRFSMTDTDYETCAKDPRSYVRYMVMERAGVTVWHMMHSIPATAIYMRFRVAVGMAIDVIGNLEKLHTAGIVHGDIHPGNLVRLSNSRFGFIDFGKSFFEADMTSPFDWFDSHCFLSHWNLQGSRFGFPDDVYKALLVASFIAVPGRYDECSAMGKAEKRRGELIIWHANNSLFEPLDVSSFKQAFPNVTKRAIIRHSLWNALEVARSVASVSARPNYSGILAHLKTALDNMK